MLNEDRIKLMTKMASYEEKEGKKILPIGTYFRSDFIGIHLIKSAIAVSLSYLLIVGMGLIYKAEYFMKNINSMNLVDFGKNLLMIYILVLFVYLLIAYVIYATRYTKAKGSIKRYYSQLRRISKLYENEEIKQAPQEKLGGNRNHDSFTGI